MCNHHLKFYFDDATYTTHQQPAQQPARMGARQSLVYYMGHGCLFFWEVVPCPGMIREFRDIRQCKRMDVWCKPYAGNVLNGVVHRYHRTSGSSFHKRVTPRMK